MAEETSKGEEVNIRRSEISVPSIDGEPETVVYITYTTKDLSPGLVTIPKKEWTQEKERDLIREDLKARRETKPSTITV